MAKTARTRKGQDAQLFSDGSGTSALSASLTIPGAGSTVNVNRGGRLAPPQAKQQLANADEASARPGMLLEMPSRSKSGGADPQTAAADVDAKQGQAVLTPMNLPAVSEENSEAEAVAPHEMVPDVSLSEYVSHFHYEPPNEPEVVTMPSTGAAAQHQVPSSNSVATVSADTGAAVPSADAMRDEARTHETAQVSADHSMSPVSSGPSERDDESQYFSLTGEALAITDSADNAASYETRRTPPRRFNLWLAVAGIAALAALAAIGWHARARQSAAPAPLASDTQTSAPSDRQPAPPSENAEQPARPVIGPAQQPAEHSKEAANSVSQTKTAAETNTGASAPVPAVKNEPRHPRKPAAVRTNPVAHANPDAPVDLANKYLVAHNCDKALVLLKTAAGKANVRASNQLASMYAIGSCVQRNRVEAYRWVRHSLAADPDNEWAQHNRDLILRQMTPAERKDIKATR